MCYINCVALSFHPHFYSCIFHPLHCRADLSTHAFSTPALSCRSFHSCIFHPLYCRADISTPAFSTPAFSCCFVPIFPLPHFPLLHFHSWLFLYCACVSPQGDLVFRGNPPHRASMDLRPRRTRVKALILLSLPHARESPMAVQ